MRNVADRTKDKLRYTLSSCMFGVPEERVSISSPCQVSCQPLNNSISYQLTNDSSIASPGTDFCSAAQFDDTTINICAFCYSLIPQQLFLANCNPTPLSQSHLANSSQSYKLYTSSAATPQPTATPSSPTAPRSSTKPSSPAPPPSQTTPVAAADSKAPASPSPSPSPSSAASSSSASAAGAVSSSPADADA